MTRREFMTREISQMLDIPLGNVVDAERDNYLSSITEHLAAIADGYNLEDEVTEADKEVVRAVCSVFRREFGLGGHLN